MRFVAEKSMMDRNILELKTLLVNTSSYEAAKQDVEASGFVWEDWFYEKAVRPELSIDDYRFWFNGSRDYIDVVPVNKIIGQEHDSFSLRKDVEFCEPFWINELYSTGDKWPETDPDKVRTDIIKENNGTSPVHLNKYGDKYYVAEGRHRTANAKFLKMESMRCIVTEFLFDSSSFALYKRLTGIIGEEPLKKLTRLHHISFVSFDWYGLHFKIRWNNESIDAFEKQVTQARRIESSIIVRPLLMMFFTQQEKGQNAFSLDNKTKIHDFRAPLIIAIRRSRRAK